MINFHACSAENLKKGVSLVTSMFCPFLNGSLKMARGLDAKKKKRRIKVNQRNVALARAVRHTRQGG
jgi:hypothetical protein